ncbi:hypothetical protein YC2023_114899 [Brassica napus]
MDKSSIQCFLFILLTIIVTMISCSNAQREVEDESEFSYVRNQENGPEKWGKLKPEWKMCGKGKMQSPIDLMHKRVRIVSHLGRLTRNYKPSNATLRNRGHDMMMVELDPYHGLGPYDESTTVRFEEGSSSIRINNVEYQLHQLHWHSPSEHTINGRRFALELHMVHESLNGSLAVVTVLYKIGRPDSFLNLLENKLSAMTDPNEEKNIGMIDPRGIKFGSRKYYRYIGSLTIPPCTQNVIWTVVKEVKTVARNQVKLLRVAVHDDVFHEYIWCPISFHYYHDLQPFKILRIWRPRRVQEADAQPQEDSVDSQEPAMTSSIRNDPTGRSANRDSKKEEEKCISKPNISRRS